MGTGPTRGQSHYLGLPPLEVSLVGVWGKKSVDHRPWRSYTYLGDSWMGRGGIDSDTSGGGRAPGLCASRFGGNNCWVINGAFRWLLVGGPFLSAVL